MHGTARIQTKKKKSAKAFWMKQLHTWHWVSSAVSLIGLLLFAFTGITLNHAADVEGSPQTIEKSATLPADLLKQVAPDDAPDAKKPLPAAIAAWVEKSVGQVGAGDAEWSADEVYLALPRPGGDGWVSIDRHSGAVTSEATSRGWISYLNDLHKGRNAGGVWKWFIDIFAVACFLFALTGLVLLQIHAKKRPSTWPLVAAGLAIPAILAIIFIH
ncbi:PepSY-associated TM helix domain-containing protein [Sphingobium sp. CR2-8]|uniref:PepSY-associated TM helix domain-containing protein n=1 Tax=Sphingobium sp. CR2-8 TaxID=1306534 RepID=UPI002DBE7449|nr:PepSY-associated TM helix domain-containing protein [Sphingobium sp. CR2-8]MEC3910354.1 PepSY-associated TM helix domain-containing protein [Sphingobium sp. CR2-8]